MGRGTWGLHGNAGRIGCMHANVSTCDNVCYIHNYINKLTIYVVVPGRKRTLFRRVFRSHPRVKSAVALNFR